MASYTTNTRRSPTKTRKQMICSPTEAQRVMDRLEQQTVVDPTYLQLKCPDGMLLVDRIRSIRSEIMLLPTSVQLDREPDIELSSRDVEKLTRELGVSAILSPQRRKNHPDQQRASLDGFNKERKELLDKLDSLLNISGVVGVGFLTIPMVKTLQRKDEQKDLEVQEEERIKAETRDLVDRARKQQASQDRQRITANLQARVANLAINEPEYSDEEEVVELEEVEEEQVERREDPVIKGQYVGDCVSCHEKKVLNVFPCLHTACVECTACVDRCPSCRGSLSTGRNTFSEEETRRIEMLMALFKRGVDTEEKKDPTVSETVEHARSESDQPSRPTPQPYNTSTEVYHNRYNEHRAWFKENKLENVFKEARANVMKKYDLKKKNDFQDNHNALSFLIDELDVRKLNHGSIRKIDSDSD